MRVYISGAITGQPNNNRTAFRIAQRKIEGHREFLLAHQKKLKIVNPQDIGKTVKQVFATLGYGEPEWEDYMRACIKDLCRADCVFFLPDWVQSEGASMERYIAKKLKIKCFDTYNDLSRFFKEAVSRANR